MFEATNNKENINLESTIFPSYLIHICELYSCKVCDVMWSIVCFVECLGLHIQLSHEFQAMKSFTIILLWAVNIDINKLAGGHT